MSGWIDTFSARAREYNNRMNAFIPDRGLDCLAIGADGGPEARRSGPRDMRNRGEVLYGQIVILNGAPRSGKSSIVEVVQETFDGVWMNLGVDCFKERVIPQKYSPSIGLRPGGEAPHLEALIVDAYTAMYESIAAQSRAGLHVVVDVGHHDSYSKPLGILRRSARALSGFPVLFVGVRCPIEEIMERRRKTLDTQWRPGDPVPEPILRWQREVHKPGIYDLEVDTAVLSPRECAAAIEERLADSTPPTAFERIAALS